MQTVLILITKSSLCIYKTMEHKMTASILLCCTKTMLHRQLTNVQHNMYVVLMYACDVGYCNQMSRCNATLWSLQCPTAIITIISVDRSAFECGFPIPTVVCTHYSCSVPTWSQFDLYFVQIVQKVVVVIIIIIPFVTVGISLFCCLIEDKNNDNYAECTRSMHKHAV